MKRLINVKEPIEHPEPDATKQQRAEMPTIKRLLNAFCMNYVPKDADTSEILFQAGFKIRSCGDFVDLEDGELRKIKDLLATNPTQLSTFLHGTLMKAIKEAEERKLEVEIKEVK